MITVKELKAKLEGFRRSTGYLFEMSVDKDGEVILRTSMKLKNGQSTLTDDAELVSLLEA